ncbi:MAG: ThuA domain-containing protein [Bacteroidales bacterium]|nr:ThuA domain-containing protein [Bacteroidales bacterium]
MKRTILISLFLLFSAVAFAQNDSYPADYAKSPRFKALIYYTTNAETDHVLFAEKAVEYFKRLTYGDGFYLDVTTEFKYTLEQLMEYDILIMLNASPVGEMRPVFEKYMENGGGWLGFHSSGYNDRSTNWPWYNDFLGVSYFLCNNWPAQSALLCIENPNHEITKNIPSEFVSAPTEFYQFEPNPKMKQHLEVLVSLSQKNYPIGIKDVVKWGEWPVVWTNTKYRMIYFNMGHSEESFMSETQNLLMLNCFRWVLSQDKKGDPFKKQ